jgi:hypothetical protein
MIVADAPDAKAHQNVLDSGSIPEHLRSGILCLSRVTNFNQSPATRALEPGKNSFKPRSAIRSRMAILQHN